MAAINEDVLAADEAETLAEVLVEDGIGNGDVLAGRTFGARRANIEPVAARAIAGDSADGHVAGAFDIQAVAIFAAVAGMFGGIFGFAHLEDYARCARAR